jgi:hypothetical protein
LKSEKAAVNGSNGSCSKIKSSSFQKFMEVMGSCSKMDGSDGWNNSKLKS